MLHKPEPTELDELMTATAMIGLVALAGILLAGLLGLAGYVG